MHLPYNKCHLDTDMKDVNEAVANKIPKCSLGDCREYQPSKGNPGGHTSLETLAF